MIKKLNLKISSRFLPKREDKSNKRSFGSILVCGGSYNMSGAVYFTSMASFRSGCGLVYLFVPSSIKDVISSMIPEAVVFCGSKKNFLRKDCVKLFDLVEKLKPDLIVFGPGMGREKETISFLNNALKKLKLPVILDADALYAISISRKFQLLKNKTSILTPHTGEARRFYDLNDNRKLAIEISRQTNSVVVLKDFKTFITNGKEVYVLNRPNSALSKAGSGDILAGIIASIFAQNGKMIGFTNKTAFISSLCGVYIHSLCGKLALKRRNSYGVIASDLICEIPNAINLMKV